MKKLILILILMAFQASATVEDAGTQSVTQPGSVYPSPGSFSLPEVPELSCPPTPGCLLVTVILTGPSYQDKEYTTQGKALEFMVTVKNDGTREAEVELNVNPKNCRLEWFSWTTKTVTIPAGASRSEPLQVRPDINAVAGDDYHFEAEASAKCSQPASASGRFKIQDYDYASETLVSGTGQFQINKDVRSMSSGIKSNKDIFFGGTVDALVKNEYLVERAKGRNPNFEEQDAVENYQALRQGDALFGTESFKSSSVFGGVGAKVQESYNVWEMEFKKQDFNLHQTGALKKMAEFRTADNFTGFYLLDAKQIRPGQRSIKEHEEYMGAFEINRRFVFRDTPTTTSSCFTGTCESFVNRLNAFSQSA